MSEQSEEKLPQRTKAHVIGDRALNVFKVKANPEWACEEKRIDYGYDLNIHIAKDEKVREHFFIQLKGHESPNYIEDKKFISEQIEVSTINFLQLQAIPAMICVCHVDLKQENEEPIFYIWLEDAIKEIQKVNKNWRNQEHVNIRIPTTNIINKEAEAQIFDFVTEHYRTLKTSKIVVDVLGPAIGIEKEKIGKLTTEETLYAIAPHLEKAGLIDDSLEGVEALTPQDQEILRKIKETSVLLNSYNHEAAQQILDEIAPQIDKTHNSIKAHFYNNYGVLHMHLGKISSAFEYYQKAVNLKPSNTKYLTNFLYAEYDLFIKHDKSEPDKEMRWIERLERLIKENKDIHSAIRLKTIWIGKKQGCGAAFKFIKSTETWSKEPTESRICIAEIFKNENKYDEAISILREAEREVELDNFYFWSLYGYVLFSQALGIFSKEKESYITALGLTKIKFALLKEAEQRYKKAYDILFKKGFPIFIEDIAVNYTSVLHFLGKYEESLHVCKTVLARYADSKGILGQIALSYSNLGKPEEAIPFAQKAFEANKNTTTLKNYCLCLMEAEEYADLKDVLDEYINNDIIEREKGLFYGLYAISCNEIGLPEKADEYLQTMKKDDSFFENAIITESVICHKNGGERDEVLEIYKMGLSKDPKSILLHTNYANNLKPYDKNEAREIISSYEIIKEVRELYPNEYIAYGQAYLTLNKPEEAVFILKKAHENYPDNAKIQYILAGAYASSGDEESAYIVLEKYFEKSTLDYHIIRNMATLAFDTGRLDESIKFFQKALSKTTDLKIRGEIHCHLFELKRRRGGPQKDALRHIHEFGKTIKDDVDMEARYLAMFMYATINYTAVSAEENEWFSVASKRLDNFNMGKYKSPYFKSFRFDPNIPEEKKGMDILSTIMAEMLPHIMKSEQMSIAIRSNAYPLTIKSRFLNRGASFFGFWSICMQSKEKEYVINIFYANNNLEKEDQIAKTAKRICIDISALLTLAEFDLLETLNEFDLVFLARGTKTVIDSEFFGLAQPHELARKIEDWRLAKKGKIRVKNYVATDKKVSNDNLIIRRDKPLQEVIAGGMGESILIAQQLKIPLYSDDSTMRLWANNEYYVDTFSTISLVNILTQKGNIKINDAVELFAKMIRKNYVFIPFNIDHLNIALKQAIKTYIDKNKNLPCKTELLADETLGTYISQFGNTSYDHQSLLNVATDWWIKMIENANLPKEIVQYCVESTSYRLSMRTKSTIIGGISKEEQKLRYASIWTRLFLKAVFLDIDIARAWSTIKSVCESLLPRSEGDFNEILLKKIPKMFIEALENNKEFDNIKKIETVYKFTSSLPPNDKERVELYIQKNKPNFMQ